MHKYKILCRTQARFIYLRLLVTSYDKTYVLQNHKTCPIRMFLSSLPTLTGKIWFSTTQTNILIQFSNILIAYYNHINSSMKLFNLYISLFKIIKQSYFSTTIKKQKIKTIIYF